MKPHPGIALSGAALALLGAGMIPHSASAATAAARGGKSAEEPQTAAAANGGGPGEILQIANADGAHVRTVTLPQSVKSCRYFDLQWSPDSRTLAFLSNCNHGANAAGQFDIYEVGAQGIGARRISHLLGSVNQLAWTPNGSELSFLYVQGDVHPVSAVSATKAQVGVREISGRDQLERAPGALNGPPGGRI